MTDEERQRLCANLRADAYALTDSFALHNRTAADEIERLAALVQSDTEPRCPRCGSHDPARHPAVQFEGEVQICPHPFHDSQSDVEPSLSDQMYGFHGAGFNSTTSNAEPVACAIANRSSELGLDADGRVALHGICQEELERYDDDGVCRPLAEPVSGLIKARAIALEQRCERGTPWDLACVTIANKIGEQCGYPPIPTDAWRDDND